MNLFGLWRQNCSVCSSWSRPSSLSWDSRGKYISPAPPFLTLCRAFISRGLRPYRPRRRTLSSLLVRLRRPTLHRSLRSLRQGGFALYVRLRHYRSSLLAAASNSLTFVRGADRACCAPRKRRRGITYHRKNSDSALLYLSLIHI